MDLTQIAALIGSVTGLISLILFSRFKMDGMRINNEGKVIKNLQSVIAEIRKESDNRREQDEKEKNTLRNENEKLVEKVDRLELDVDILKQAQRGNSIQIDMYDTAMHCRPLCPKKGDCAITIKFEELKKEYKEIKK